MKLLICEKNTTPRLLQCFVSKVLVAGRYDPAYSLVGGYWSLQHALTCVVRFVAKPRNSGFERDDHMRIYDTGSKYTQ